MCLHFVPLAELIEIVFCLYSDIDTLLIGFQEISIDSRVFNFGDCWRIMSLSILSGNIFVIELLELAAFGQVWEVPNWGFKNPCHAMPCFPFTLWHHHVLLERQLSGRNEFTPSERYLKSHHSVSSFIIQARLNIQKVTFYRNRMETLIIFSNRRYVIVELHCLSIASGFSLTSPLIADFRQIARIILVILSFRAPIAQWKLGNCN